jgi:hypothetical protein
MKLKSKKNLLIAIILGLSAVLVITLITIKYVEYKEDQAKQLEEAVAYNESKFNGNGGVTNKDRGKIYNGMSEGAVRNIIHYMSHQKVKASKKWGAFHMTSERIDKLIAIVEGNNYLYRDKYLDILYRWQRGDFSRVDKDHNIIWTLQGGTIGKATGIMSPIEEKNYIKKHFGENY